MRSFFRAHPWWQSVAVTAVAVLAALWLWFGPWLWSGIPWLVALLIPFLMGLMVMRVPLLFGILPALIPYLIQGHVDPKTLLSGLGASYIATGLGIFIRRLTRGGLVS
jgi:hypothetical protein